MREISRGVVVAAAPMPHGHAACPGAGRHSQVVARISSGRKLSASLALPCDVRPLIGTRGDGSSRWRESRQGQQEGLPAQSRQGLQGEEDAGRHRFRARCARELTRSDSRARLRAALSLFRPPRRHSAIVSTWCRWCCRRWPAGVAPFSQFERH